MAVIDQLKDFVFLEMPQRIVLIQGNVEAIGNPNLSTLPKVQASPLGTHYLQDDVNPKVLYVRVNNGTTSDWISVGEIDSSKLEHNKLKNLQGGSQILNEFIHLSNLEKVKYDNYDNRINNQQIQITNVNKRVSDLEQQVFNTPLPPSPIISNSVLDGQSIDLTINKITEVVFPIDSSAGLITINNALKIYSNPLIVASSPYIRLNTLTGKNEIVVPVSGLNDGKTYKIDIDKGLISDNGVENNGTISCTFSTIGVLKEPIINDGNLNGLDNLDITTTTELLFEVIGNSVGSISLLNDKAWSCPIPSIVSSMELITTGTQQFIKFNLQNLLENMTYSIDILAGAIDNTVGTDKYTNLSGKNATFKTTPSNTILTTPTLPALVDFTTFNKIVIPITTTSGRKFNYTVDNSKITSIPSIIKNISIIGNNLEISLNPLLDNTNYKIDINTDAVLNSGKGNLSPISISFVTGNKPLLPVILNNTTVNGSIQPLNITNINFDITGGNASDLVIDISKIICTPNIIKNSIVDLINNKLIVNIDNTLLMPNTNYILKINNGAIGYKGDNISVFGTTLSTNSIVCAFQTVNIPKLLDVSINGKQDVDKTTLTTIQIPYTSPSPVNLDISKIVTTTLPILSSSIVGNNIELTINNTSLNYSTDYTITLQKGVITDSVSGLSNTSDLIINFRSKGDIPVISSNIYPSNVVYHKSAITYLDFEVQATGLNVSIQDTSKIISAPTNILMGGMSLTNIGTNLYKLRVPVGNMKNDTSYEIRLLEGLINNDYTLNNTKFVYNFTTSKDYPVITPPTITYVDGSSGNSIIEFTLSDLGLTYMGGIIANNCTLGIVNIVGNKLQINISGLIASNNCSLTIPIGTISNGTVSNLTPIILNFTIQGIKPIINLPTINGNTTVDPTVTTNIDFDVIFGTGVNSKILDKTKIYSPQGILGTITFNSTTNKISIPVTLNYNKSYDIYLYEGTIKADGSLNDYKLCSFSTMNNPVPPIPPTSGIDWTYEFVLKNARNEYDLSTDSSFTHVLPTIDDLYTNNKIELYYLGYDGTPITPKKVPISGVDTFTAPTTNGGYSFWSDGYIVFDTGGYGNMRFKMIKKL